MKRLLWISTVLLTLLLSACDDSDENLSRYILKVKNRPLKPIEPIPSFKPIPIFVFPESDNRRNPFKAMQVSSQADKFAPNMNRLKQPLEAFPLDALKFVGLLKQGNLVWGLISQPGGLVTRIKVGDYMGQDYGQVVQINDQSIRIEETQLMSGRWHKKTVTFQLFSPENNSRS